jgi:hypothetical protein
MISATQNALDYVRNLSEQAFWGLVSLKFENGTIVHVRQEENLKPSELPGKNRGEYANRTNY